MPDIIFCYWMIKYIFIHKLFLITCKVHLYIFYEVHQKNDIPSEKKVEKI